MAELALASSNNHLLASLSPDDAALLEPGMHQVALKLDEVLHRPQEHIDMVHFPLSGWLSMVARMEDGDSAEVGLVGREGLVGLALTAGDDRSTLEALVQADGTAMRLDGRTFQDALERSRSLRQLVGRFGLASHAQVAQTAACNGRHQIEQRLARWLLMAHDRADDDQFPMTQEFLGTMLAVRRASITIAARLLQKARLIDYAHGRITILDRAGLEAAACECHGIVKREFDRLLGPMRPIR